MNQDNSTYLIGCHQYALYYWLKCIEQNRISRNATLIHIDLHSDYLKPRNENLTMNSSGDVLRHIASGHIRHDTFIIPALKNKIISNILFCCNVRQNNDFGVYRNFETPTNILNHVESNVEISNDLILNIDIDYFLEFQDSDISLRPMLQEKIVELLEIISTLKERASITTIATSPEIFVNKPEWRKDIFYTVLEILKIKRAK